MRGVNRDYAAVRVARHRRTCRERGRSASRTRERPCLPVGGSAEEYEGEAHQRYTFQFKLMAPGVTLDDVGLQTFQFTLFAVGYGYIATPPVVTGAYPVTAEISAFGVHEITSVVAVPVAVVVTTVAQAPEVIADVPIAEVPLAMRETLPAGPVGPVGPVGPAGPTPEGIAVQNPVKLAVVVPAKEITIWLRAGVTVDH